MKTGAKEMDIESISMTPNPDALKFTVSQQLIENGSRSYTSKTAAYSDPLASLLFELDGLTSVFYLKDFITVTKTPETDWDSLEPKVIEALKQYQGEDAFSADDAEMKTQAANAPVAYDTDAEAEVSDYQMMTPAQKILFIDRVLDEDIRPGLAGDGGGLEIISFEDNNLKIRYEGACGCCPSSTAGTLYYIQNLLRKRVDPKITVTPV